MSMDILMMFHSVVSFSTKGNKKGRCALLSLKEKTSVTVLQYSHIGVKVEKEGGRGEDTKVYRMFIRGKSGGGNERSGAVKRGLVWREVNLG
jgi:hypothetical protein